MWPRRGLAALLLSASLLTAGCGGDGKEKNAYVEAVQGAQRAYVVRFTAVTEQLKPANTTAEDRAALADLDAATGRFATALEDIDPPEGVRGQHTALTKAVVAYRAQVERAREGLRGGTASKRDAARKALAKDVVAAQAKIAQAIADVNNGLRA